MQFSMVDALTPQFDNRR